jgi:hypothetical protein
VCRGRRVLAASGTGLFQRILHRATHGNILVKFCLIPELIWDAQQREEIRKVVSMAMTAFSVNQAFGEAAATMWSATRAGVRRVPPGGRHRAEGASHLQRAGRARLRLQRRHRARQARAARRCAQGATFASSHRPSTNRMEPLCVLHSDGVDARRSTNTCWHRRAPSCIAS